jgi:regulator of protease activity HflC (stomatin/prohibitin superfamily)
MNAIDPVTPHPNPEPDDAGQTVAQPGRLFVEKPSGLPRWLSLTMAASAASLGGIWWVAPRLPAMPLLAGVRHDGLLPVAAAALLLALSGLAGTWIMTWARRRAIMPSSAEPTRRRWPARTLTACAIQASPSLPGRAARWPQAIVVTVIAVLAVVCAWVRAAAPDLVPAPDLVIVPPAIHFALGGIALVLAFPLLVAERMMAATPAARLPEAPALRALLLLPVLVFSLAGLARIGSGLGIPFAGRLNVVLALFITVVAVELCLRALGRCFLPPPAAAEARAAAGSLLARMIADGLRTGGFTGPVRAHLGIDLSRGWALTYLRSAIPPVAMMLLVLCWGLSGLVLVELDQRAIYERFGAPVTILHPGLHTILPWPMGRVHRLEYGTIHETALPGPDLAIRTKQVGAEDLPPPEADRLWEQAHPAELAFLIASTGGGQQSFQTVSSDIKLRYRIGLTDQDAMHAAYGTTDPPTLLRALAGRAIAGFFAARTLNEILGENRDAVAERVRTTLQQDLDDVGTGLELAAVVIEAIHPPAGAAEAYHAVQAAEILAVTSIAAERGAAVAARAKASQYATDIITQSTATGMEMTGAAATDLIRFQAEHAAAATGGQSFLLERRLTAIGTGLAKSGLTIIDHRIPAEHAPVLDLRPVSPMTVRGVGPNQE